MGVLASTMRLMTLTATKNDLEFRLMSITEKMSALTAQIAEKDEFCADLDPESTTVRQMEAEKKRLNELERKLDMQQKMLQARLQQVMQEMQACQQMLGADIQSGMFSYGMGMGR
ncbi:hypothetical protein J6O48_01170 [bacterium]|nr:hypothetical protein [bacterium]